MDESKLQKPKLASEIDENLSLLPVLFKEMRGHLNDMERLQENLLHNSNTCDDVLAAIDNGGSESPVDHVNHLQGIRVGNALIAAGLIDGLKKNIHLYV